MKVLCDKHGRRNFQMTISCKTSITTLQCICANGTVIPPAVLFPGVKFNPKSRMLESLAGCLTELCGSDFY